MCVVLISVSYFVRSKSGLEWSTMLKSLLYYEDDVSNAERHHNDLIECPSNDSSWRNVLPCKKMCLFVLMGMTLAMFSMNWKQKIGIAMFDWLLGLVTCNGLCL